MLIANQVNTRQNFPTYQFSGAGIVVQFASNARFNAAQLLADA